MVEQIKNETSNEDVINKARDLEKSFQENNGEWNDVVYSYFDHGTGYSHTGKKLDGCHIADECNYHGASQDGTNSWTVIQVGTSEGGLVHLLNEKFEEIAKKIIENEEENS